MKHLIHEGNLNGHFHAKPSIPPKKTANVNMFWKLCIVKLEESTYCNGTPSLKNF